MSPRDANDMIGIPDGYKRGARSGLNTPIGGDEVEVIRRSNSEVRAWKPINKLCVRKKPQRENEAHATPFLWN